MVNDKANIEKIFKKYAREFNEDQTAGDVSREYSTFKQEAMPQLSKYERLCKSVGSFINIRISDRDSERIGKSLSIAHINATPSQAFSLAVISTLIAFFIGLIGFVVIYLATETFSLLFLFLSLVFSMFIFYYFYSAPERYSMAYRLKASSQMVPCILYIVIYMRHTSNLERAIKFASEHLQAPLAFDFKKIFWDVETGKYSTIKESLDAYLDTWRDYSLEFIESFHLIESSLYESDEGRRKSILEKALDVILDGVYEKMLKYSHSVRSPLTNLYMLGIVLPTLGLALLPLASTLLQGMIKWYHVLLFFNIIIPFFVYYMTSNILAKRPGGYGESEILEMSPLYKKYTDKKPYLIAFFIALPFLLIGISPLLFQYTGLPGLLGLNPDFSFKEIGLGFFGDIRFFDFKEINGGFVGPFGIGAIILSLFIPLGVAFFFSISYTLKTKELVKVRDESKRLEKEFVSSLFQLGNRLGDGVPAEVAFARILENVKGTSTENFFRTVNLNLQQRGMSLEESIFNKKVGAILYFPSALISTSMKILVESVKKGLKVAALSLMSISQYVKNIDKINERLHDLLAEVSSDMKGNMTFLAPLLAGIVVGLSSMITTILSKLTGLFSSNLADSAVMGSGNLQIITQIFDLTKMIPPYYLQIAVGVYIVEIVFILTNALVGIDAGVDKLKEKSEIASNLKIAILLYFVTALTAVLLLSLLAGFAVTGLG
ncbi:hypothetical protein COV15_02660 [Candidatus Woesearchaeota archaeon CG10_big_fil_rev_8_21_14_0_10_34_12]|nr:MAG: hypothetical protein COV15_02660 [Candidatus Woesearchaeota archaeon CG10_big_fil_rev_8_21_14_0_10_34_12]